MRRALSLLLITAGLALAGWVALDSTGDDVGNVTVGASAPAATPDPAEPSPSTSPTPAPQASPSAPQAPPSTPPRPATNLPPITTSSGSIGDVDLSRPPAPRRIEVPSLGIDAEVVPVGTDDVGEIIVPDDVSTTGWYWGSSAPSQDLGNVVLIGHVDSRSQGRGAFFDLRVADVGSTVTLTDEESATTTWEVTGRRTFEKTSIPMDDVNSFYGEQRLLLITCGGDFDPVARSYESIVIVEAKPMDA